MSYRWYIITLIEQLMFFEYLLKLRASGKIHFNFQEILQELQVSENGAKSGLYRLKTEYQPYGSIPAEQLVPIIMKHLNAKYYVALLSAVTYFGAAHQKPARFQVISNIRIKHSLEFGKVIIDLIYKYSLDNLPTKNFIVSTGLFKGCKPRTYCN